MKWSSDTAQPTISVEHFSASEHDAKETLDFFFSNAPLTTLLFFPRGKIKRKIKVNFIVESELQ